MYVIPVLYIFGGKKSSEISSELWKYDSGSNTYEMISADAPNTVYHPRCAIDTSESYFYVMYGEGEGETPLGYIDRYNLVGLT